MESLEWRSPTVVQAETIPPLGGAKLASLRHSFASAVITARTLTAASLKGRWSFAPSSNIVATANQVPAAALCARHGFWVLSVLYATQTELPPRVLPYYVTPTQKLVVPTSDDDATDPNEQKPTVFDCRPVAWHSRIVCRPEFMRAMLSR